MIVLLTIVNITQQSGTRQQKKLVPYWNTKNTCQDGMKDGKKVRLTSDCRIQSDIQSLARAYYQSPPQRKMGLIKRRYMRTGISKTWKPPENIKSQSFGWGKKANLGWVGRIDTGGPIG